MQIVLHIGVHKTATTYLQAILEASRDRLGAEGIGYVTLEEMRSGITARVGGYIPSRAEMNDNASAVKKAPEGLDW